MIKPATGNKQSLPMKSPLVIRSAWCFTCRVPELPSVRVQRHTQNRRRYSLNSPSQGGGPAQRKKQNDRIRNQRQIHSGEGRGGETCNYTSQGKQLPLPSHTKLSHMKRSHIRIFCVGPSVRFLYLLYRKHIDKSPVLAAKLSQVQ